MILLLYIIYLCFWPVYSQPIQCMDENNRPVDWFVASKLPEIIDSQDPRTKAGKSYMVITSESVQSGWSLSDEDIDGGSTLLDYTLAPLYKAGSERNSLWIVYNDQPPRNHKRLNEVNGEVGHTKGVIAADMSGGFWLVHSVPRFPDLSKRGYPTTGLKNGQSVLCVSMSPDSLLGLSKVLTTNQPLAYSVFTKNLQIQTKYSELLASAQQPSEPVYPYSYSTQISSVANTTFTVFAKADMFDRDLYEWVGEQLVSNLLVESWPNEKGALPSSCSSQQYTVENVDTLGVNITQSDQVMYHRSKDHSKWAVSKDNDSEPNVCIGDINRALPQEKRGGGTVCLANAHLRKAYQNLIQSIEKC